MDEKFIIPVEIIALLEEPNLQAPVIVLHSRQPNKVLPIFIGHPEAKAIALVLQNVQTERPLTHELLYNTVKAMKGKINKIVVDKLEKTTYCATIHVTVTGSSEKVEIDARPSDAIALALRSHTPIFVSRALMEKAGQDNPFEGQVPQPAEQKEMSPDELKKVKKLLKEAQKREQGED